MAMAGLGRPDEIWRSPLHYFLTLRTHYLDAITPVDEDEDEEVESTVEVARGVTLETIKQKREGTFSE